MFLRPFSCRASDVLTVTVLPAGRAGVGFLDWDIKGKRQVDRLASVPDASFQGPGLYALCFDDKLIYIGSYLGKKPSLFSGDVVQLRWWTHIGAITMRGSRVHVAPKSLKALQASNSPAGVLLSGLLGASDSDLLHEDEGNLSPLRRMRFADCHSNVFLDAAADAVEILGRFKFVYCRIDPKYETLDPRDLRRSILSAETALIVRYSPSCNTKGVQLNKPAIEVNFADVEKILTDELSRLI
ncbi:MAG: hypothetical protein GC196_01180 [Hyphomonas sp.]|nr:hypothetical protein [Hyphomonas sp.]